MVLGKFLPNWVSLLQLAGFRMEKLMVNASWDDVESFISYLRLKDTGKWQAGVYGIPRGGNVLAAIISYRFHIPLLAAPCEGCLVVDDISDSGKTLLHYREKGYEIATMYFNKETAVMPDYCFFEKYGKNEWIVFPWEDGNV